LEKDNRVGRVDVRDCRMTRNTSFVCTSLLTTAEFPLIIRSRPDNEVHIRGGMLEIIRVSQKAPIKTGIE